MSLAVKIKAGSINNLSDARYFAVFAEWVGFCFDAPAPIIPATARELMSWIVGPHLVAECGMLGIETINRLVAELSIEAVQADYDLDMMALHPIVTLFIRRIVLTAHTKPADVKAIMDKYPAENSQIYFLLDFGADKSSEGGRAALPARQNPNSVWTDQLLHDWCKHYRIILSLSNYYTPENILEFVNTINPLGIEILGETEKLTGMRSFDNLNDIIDALEC